MVFDATGAMCSAAIRDSSATSLPRRVRPRACVRDLMRGEAANKRTQALVKNPVSNVLSPQS